MRSSLNSHKGLRNKDKNLEFFKVVTIWAGARIKAYVRNAICTLAACIESGQN